MKKGRVSIKDVAAAAGVSRAAVSLVLNNGKIRISDEKRERIIRVAKEMGYTPHVGARRLAIRKMETIGLVFAENPDALSQLYLFELTHTIAAEAKKHGYDILINFFNPEDENDLPTTPGRVDGSLMVVGRNINPDVFTQLTKVDHPFVVIGGGFLTPKPTNFVDVDVSTGMMIATRHMLQLGHRRIAFVAGARSEDKLNGYIVALTKAKVPIHPEYIIDSARTDFDIERTVQTLINMEKPPTAIVTTNDWLAIRMIRTLRDHNVNVPQQVSVTGFDNTETAGYVTPAMTTVRVPGSKIADIAVKHLVGMIDRTVDKPIQVMLPAELVIRESTARAHDAFAIS